MSFSLLIPKSWYKITRAVLGQVCLSLAIMGMAKAQAGQQVAVSGTVSTAAGETLPGVSVVIKNSGTGTTTDVNGKFSINVADANSTLVFSYVGYSSQEIALAGKTQLNVVLEPSKQTNLEEVVVIGYQSVRKKDLTGAVASISPQDANRVTSSSLGESLQGLSPGVTVRTSGAPGAGAEIEIRGIGSYLSSAPLYVIDGMLSDANVTVNNNDIESIQILKDASAAAIYGSRAANGVIIITTKQGKNGPPKITFSAKYGKQYIPKKWDVMNSTQYAAIKRQEYLNSGTAADQIPASIAAGTFNPSINTDWQKLDERAGNDQDYNVTISGGTDHSKYLVSGSYYDNQSVLLANSFNRASLRINTESKKGILTFGENALLTNTNTRVPNEGSPFFDLPTSLPTVPVKDPKWINSTNPQGFTNGTNDQGQNVDLSYANNILAGNQVSSQYTNNAKLISNAFAQLQLTSWLYYKFNIGLETSFDYTRNLFDGIPIRYGTPSASSAVNEVRGQFTNLLMEHTLNFNKSFGEHTINGVFGFTQQREKDTFTGGGRTDLTFIDGAYQTSINSATGDPTSLGGTGTDFKIISYLGRVNYTFNDKYLFTATGRIDQDSRFGANFQTGFFPSLAAAWRINRESFFKADWIDDLKLSGSYGVLGVNTIPQFANMGYINNAPRAVFGNDVIANGAYQASLYNPDVHWESRHETNIGLDATILNNRLTVSAAVYRNVSKDALLIEQLPGYLGANNNPYINAGSISNKGIEFSATYRDNSRQFKWSISGNVTTIKNKVLSVGDQGGADYLVQNPDITRAQVGHPIGSWYVLKDIGLFQSQAEINNYKRSNGDLIEPFAKPGDIKFYADPNGTGQISNNDRVFNGSALPNLQTGLQFNAAYKQFTMNIQLVGVFGSTIFDAVRQTLDSYQTSNFRADINPWTPTNTHTADPRLGLAGNDAGIVSNNTYASSRWLENGSYGRIRNLEIGYALPKSLLTQWHIDNARIFISGQNLLTVTRYKGQDPDVTGNLTQPGFDNGGWPPSRILSLGINCGF
ncbi:SusC/RagA family TonB-linked outer membrane protein [Mucilaginibacter corticis]|uniref:SusC/RagA family TonB-linked outer membrane protein n=1 Tax=Mucilaginibacter corticis TaxID=2597670 RepID=UPI001C925C0D|nr:TonB-dependent receptor [Mucilaginibacter corticis]